VKDRDPSPGPSHGPQKRVSMTGALSDNASHDVTSAALAAVASSRRSPTGNGNRRSRQPLPREFRDDQERHTRSESRVRSISIIPYLCIDPFADFGRANDTSS
jgi:hypothetical protein